MKNENNSDLTEANKDSKTVKQVLYDLTLHKLDDSVEELKGMWVPIRPNPGQILTLKQKKYVVEKIFKQNITLRAM